MWHRHRVVLLAHVELKPAQSQRSRFDLQLLCRHLLGHRRVPGLQPLQNTELQQVEQHERRTDDRHRADRKVIRHIISRH